MIHNQLGKQELVIVISQGQFHKQIHYNLKLFYNTPKKIWEYYFFEKTDMKNYNFTKKIYKLFSIFIFLISYYINSQTIKIICAETNESIQYANIIFKKGDSFIKGNYFDKEGIFKFNNKENYDNLNITCIGYNNIIINKKIISDTIIKMIVKENLLNEVIVYNKSSNKKMLPKFEKSNKTLALAYGTEIAIFIQNLFNKEIKANNLIFNIYKLKNKVTLRIKFYKKSESYPKEEVYLFNIVEEIFPQKEEEVKINLDKYDIIIPTDGIFVAIEGLEGVDENQQIFLNKNQNFQFKTLKNYSTPFYSKNNIHNNYWLEVNKFLTENYKLSFGKEIKKDNLFIPDINIEISE